MRQNVPGVADQRAPRPRDGGRPRLGRRPAGEGGAPPAWHAVRLPGTISFVRKAIRGDIHNVNTLTVGVNVTPDESRDDVDNADGLQQGDPVNRSSWWDTGGVRISGSVSGEVRRREEGLPIASLSMRLVKSLSSSLAISWVLVVSPSLSSSTLGDVLFSLDVSGWIPATLKQLSLKGMTNWFRSHNPVRTRYPSNSANIGGPGTSHHRMSASRWPCQTSNS